MPAMRCLLLALLCAFASSTAFSQNVDLSQYDPTCGVQVQQHGNNLLEVAWPIANQQYGRLTLNLEEGSSLISRLGVAANADGDFAALAEDVEPVVWVTEGSRQTPAGVPSEQFWMTFFDNPHQRPHATGRSERTGAGQVKIQSQGRRAEIQTGRVQVGSFAGYFQFTCYADSPLIRIESIVSTDKDNTAIIYDAGLVTKKQTWSEVTWFDTEGETQRQPLKNNPNVKDTPLAVRYRAIAASGPNGSIVCFPAPHQFQFPRDYSDNLRFVWYGENHGGDNTPFGIGIRQSKDGGGAFVPWFNAPPDTQQRLSIFCLVSNKDASGALAEVLDYTHRDRFPALPGYLTMTSHWHMAIAVAAMQRQGEARTDPKPPDFVRMFRDMNVNLVHLAEFHGDGHQMDGGEVRLAELEAMFAECRRWSDNQLLFIPGEEVNTFLGLDIEGKHPGHWMSLFPKPVNWIMQREGDQPFVEQHPRFGRVYRVGSRGDMIRLLREENGLVWSAHPRIKASNWTPDIFREEDFFIADYWLGGAWKAMPADLSRAKLGERVLDLLDDMANWGHKKYVLGEVDVFKIDHTHELYAHMNINYVRLNQVPSFDEGWQPVLDAIRDGQFFVTTGEILIPEFTVAGQRSGATVQLSDSSAAELRADLNWTFPLAFAEVVSGDGQKIYRERIDLSHTSSFGRTELVLTPQLAGRRWVRLEVWDVAANGAFTQPVWLAPQ